MTLDLTSGIVRILRSDGTTSGAGFLVSKDCMITSCSHVVQSEASQSRGDPRPEVVAVVFQVTGDEGLARVEEWRPYDAEDVAILRLKGDLPEGVRDLPLGSSAGTSDHPFQTFGFPDASPEEGIWGDGHIQKVVRIKGARLLQISSKEVTPGFSGAPVLDAVTRRVVGMVTAILLPDKYGRMAETAFITPAETLREICPALKISDRPPYLGLDAFTEADAELFFGRSRVVDRLAESLRQEPRFLAVLGPSGSGKSSVVQAGLIPSLRDGAVTGSDRWEFIVARPSDHPFERLAEAGLEGASDGLVSALKSWLDLHPSSDRLVLILDQFEELLVTCPEELRRSFLAQLGEVLESDLHVTLALVMRDDFFGRFAQEAPPSLFGWVESGFVHVPSSLEKDELREIVEEPARLTGLDFEEGLSYLIVNDVLKAAPTTGRSTALPLLEFALTQLWERRDGNFLTHHAYSAIGGVTGGLARWADQAYADLEENMRPLARRVLTDLVHLGDESQGLPDSRRRRSLNTLCRNETELEQVHRAVQRLADARLLVTSMDKKTDEITVEIIHDSLIREWGRLQRWLKEDQRFLAWHQEIEPRVQAWVETSPENPAARDEGRLLRGLDLTEAREWLKTRKRDLSKFDREYIRISLKRDAQERLRWKRLYEEAERLRRIALARQLAAQSELIGNQREVLFPRSVLLSVEAVRQYPCLEADQALRHRLNLLAKPVVKIQHELGLVAVAFSPNGRLLATASYDNVAKIWDIATGREIARIKHDGPIYAVSFSPDGMLLATGSGDKTAKVIRINSTKKILKIKHRKLVFDVTFSPDGTKLATASWDNTAKIWDIVTNHEITAIQHNDIIRKVTFSPDGILFATASRDKMAKVWEVNTGALFFEMPHKHYVNSVAFSPDGKLLATSSDDKVARIWNTAGQEIRRMEHENWVLDVVFSPNGTQLATASYDCTAKVWDVGTGAEIAKMKHELQVNAVSFSPDGKLLATASEDYTASLWVAETGQEIARMAHSGGVLAAIFSPDGKRLATASHDHTAIVWKNVTLQEIAKMHHGGQVNSIAFSPDGTYLATASNDRTARIWDVATGQEIRKIEHDKGVFAVIFSPNGEQLATASEANIIFWDIANSQKIAIKWYKNSPNAIWPIKHGMYRTTKTGSFSEMKEDAIDQEINKIQQDGSFKIVTSSQDKKLIALASKEGIVTVWITATGKRIATMSHKMPVASMTFSPDGTRLATTSSDCIARVWNIATGKEIAKMQYEHQVKSVDFCPDGIHLATGSSDNTVRVWKIETGQEISRLIHENRVSDFKFSPDGSKLATASRDGTVRVWLWRPKDLIGEACSRLFRNLTPEEWEQYIPGEPYRKTCPNLP